ncbi:MAG: redoxin domain-containing protein [Candidatus Omnitrophica bacterium]|nr:redoxin domain-containing protein [Candidatus Omnitrophota bacterium]
MQLTKAPELITIECLNTDKDIMISNNVKENKITVIYAFQMLCPGCVSHSLPQAKRVHEYFSERNVVVFGLHTVFEHHVAMGPESLKAFCYENKITFPVGIDKPAENHSDPIPQTMRVYEMQGTPTIILIDAQGNIRLQIFGHLSDLVVGAEISSLLC